MEYTKKHQNLIARFFKKVGMIDEANVVLSFDEYKCEIAVAMRNASTKSNIPLSTPALLDAVRRYETRHCPIFKECTLSHCKGSILCNIYNLGGSYGHPSEQYRHLSKRSMDVPIKKRRKIMLEMLEYQTRHKPGKRAKGALKGRKGREEKNGKRS